MNDQTTRQRWWKCARSYLHAAHGDCPGRDSSTCMEPNCYATATETFTGHKRGAESLTFRTCADHKFPMAFGLIQFGLIENADFTAKDTADA